MPAPPFSPMPNGQVSSTSSSSSSSSPPLPSGPPETKGKSFLQNKPLSGFVFGLAGLAVLIVVIIAVTSYVRRRNRKRLLTDASNFSFDPKDVEDGTSAEEKYSPSGHTSYHNSGHGHAEHALGTGAAGGFAGAGMGGVSRPVPSSSPPMPVYIPQDYAGHDGVYPAQYYNLNNVAAGYNPTPNPYDMYGPRHGGYSSGQGHYGQFNPSGPGVDYLSVADPGHPVPRQLQPGIHPTQSPTFAPVFSTNPPPLNRSPPLSPPPASLQRSASNQYDLPRLPTPDNIPDTFGRRGSGDDDAYSGAFLGHDSSPPGLRTLQVNSPETVRVM